MLYQHQQEGALWLSQRTRAYLGDQPGLGKTRTLLAGLNGRVDRTLIVCPAIVRTHWAREAALLGYDGIAAGAPIVKSYEAITRGGSALMKELIGQQRIENLVMDEAHYCKHSNAQRTKQLLGVDGYARRMATVFAASGTPVPKHPGEIWTVLSSLFPQVCIEHKLKSYRQFIDRFCAVRLQFVRGKTVEKVLPEIRNEDEYKAILGKIMLRRTLDDVGIDVPPLDWQITRLDGGKLDEFSAAALFLPSHYRGRIEDMKNDPAVARARRCIGELKVAPVAEMLTSQLADSGEKLVVFAHHRTVLAGLKEMLKTFGVSYIDGDVSQNARDEAIDRFQTDPHTRVFLGQNIACQTGITLTAARRVVLVEPDWTADINLQLGKRVARIGQSAERCIGQLICLGGTLDEAIIAINHNEVRMADQLGLSA